jgi:tetratricopeptide (TPR) repeat protein
LIAREAARWRAPFAVFLFAAAAIPTLVVLSRRESAVFINVETLYRVTLARNPDADMPRINLARELAIKGRMDEAITNLQQVVALRPDDAVTHNDLGVDLLEKGRVNDAIAELQKAIALQPDYAGAHFSLGDAYFRQGRLDEAVAEFQKTVQYDPNYSQAYADLGTIYQQEHRKIKARRTTWARFCSSRGGWTRPSRIFARPWRRDRARPCRATTWQRRCC